MNLVNAPGGGLVGTALGWAACLLIIFLLPLPRIARVSAIVVLTSFILTSTGVGIAVLAGGVGPFGITTEVYGALFVVVRLIGTWTFAISMLFYIFRNNTLVATCTADDTNARVREMQTRGQTDQPLEQTDRDEGHEHRADIDAKLDADTEIRKAERQVDREERAEERQADREERRAEDERRDL